MLQVIPLHLPPGDMSKERTVQIDGTSEQIEAAKQMVEEVTSEVCSMVAIYMCFNVWKRSFYMSICHRSLVYAYALTSHDSHPHSSCLISYHVDVCV